MRRFIPYGRQHIDTRDVLEVKKVLISNWITQGPKIKEFEDALTKYCGAKYAVAVSSGTAALHLACLAAGLKKADEAITTPLTFLATANSILYTGAKPVFADIDYETANIDSKQIRRKLTKRTKAILPVHFAGLPCDMKEIAAIAKENKLFVIEDACHALGAEYKYSDKWVKVGSCRHSDMTVFSFHPVKSITTGEGGAVLTNRKDLYEKLLVLRNHGITKENSKFKIQDSESVGDWFYELQGLGFNYRITDIQCALGISQLKKLDNFINRRREIAKIYNGQLSGIEEIELPAKIRNAKSSWHLYPIRLRSRSNIEAKRKKVFDYLRKKGIGVQLHYIPVYFHPYYQQLGYKKLSCPKAEEFYIRAMSIPLYPSIKNTEKICLINYRWGLFNLA